MPRFFKRAVALLASVLLVATFTTPASSSVRLAPPSWTRNAVVYEVNVRDYSDSGTFSAVTADIPRLKSLGVDVLWLMPIYPIGELNRKGSLGSPYSVRDYKGINPDLGNADDLHALITAAHTAGMHVILDWVANHSSWDNAWITQHKDWYTQDSNGNVVPPNQDWTDVADLNYDSAGLRSAMIDAMKYWVTQFDVDGFRCDYAAGVPTDFWNSATAQLRSVKSSLWMLAEDQGEPDKLVTAFDSDYGWAFKDMLYSIGRGNGSSLDFALEENSEKYAYPVGTFPMLFITNHDENSWTGSLSMMYGTGAKTMAALTFTAPGIPLIYNGQEVDSNKQLAFFQKDIVDWTFGSAKSNAAVAFYSKLTSLKHKNAALNAGLGWSKFRVVNHTSDRVIAFTRSNGTNRVYVVLNVTAKAQKASVSWGKDAAYYYRFSDGKRLKLSASMAYSLKPWQFEIYSSVKP